MLAAINFPELPKTPRPPEAVPLSLYVWNAADQASAVTVALDGRRIFDGPVAAGQGASRYEVVALLPGPHTVAATAAGHQRTVTITVVPRGNRWVVVTWWGRELDVDLQQSPPWLANQQGQGG